ncbi:MAG: hypothetical protein H6648_10840 [Caldilineae bacterium]|nr:hypothetical protein [Chloroflexota bacterium]MCB9177642.1 hypothetical protein [Caldilineae bacterium]
MIEFKMDRRVFYGLLTVLGVGLALGLGLMLGKMMSGGEQAAAPVAPALSGADAGAAPEQAGIPLPVDDPAAAVDIIQGNGSTQSQQDPAQFQPPPQTIDYAALGINPDGELTPEQDATVSRILQTDAEAKLNDPNVIWVDVRSDVEFEQGHIPGSRNIVAYVQDDQFGTLPKDQEIILYCA